MSVVFKMGLQQFGPTEVVTAADSVVELDFLAAITSDHLDKVPKLVYADWLEERVDPRGPFLREFVHTARDPHTPLPAGEEFPLPWRQVVGVHARQLVRAYVLDGSITGSHTDRLESLLMRRARSTVYLAVTPTVDADLPPGCTKFGGRPDLPPRVEWPVFPNPRWHATSIFCSQVRLSDLRGTVIGRELPRRGLLSFFYCPHSAAPVQLHSEDGPFHRPDPPLDPYWNNSQRRWFGEDFYPLPPGRVRLIESLDLYIRSEGWEPWPEEFYRQNADRLRDIQHDMLPPGIESGVLLRQLLGNGVEYNGGTEDQVPGMRRLAVFGSDPHGPHYWGDSGQPIWYIAGTDLAAGQLENAKWTIG